MDCSSDLYLWKEECLIDCPSGTFNDKTTMRCVECSYPCTECSSETECLICYNSLFFNKGEKHCVTAGDCPIKTYPDEDTSACEMCDPSCLTCYGPYKDQCTSCNEILGYLKLEGSYGNCKEIACKENQYFDSEKLICESCQSPCGQCESEELCITCMKGYISFPSSIPNRVKCEKCPYGFDYDSKGKCIGIFILFLEICGDGLNFGTYECDDGNTFNGDGCSEECTVEVGYECHRRAALPDLCIDIMPPKAILSVLRGNVLQITFTEKVRSIVSGIVLIDFSR